MSDARLQHQLDLVTRECQEWKTRAEKAEAQVLALNLEKSILNAHISTLKRLLNELASMWDAKASADDNNQWAFAVNQCADELRDTLTVFDKATKAG